MKKIILFSLFVFIFFSGCTRNAKKDYGAETPAQATNSSSNTAANTSSSNSGEEIAKGSEESTEEISVEAGASTEFAVLSGKGMMCVSIPEGALSDVSKLNVTALAGSPEGYLNPGFLCEDKAKPGEHVMLSAPAVITYWQQEPLPENSYIVRYSDDLKETYPLPSLRIETSDGLYGLMSQTDSFSAYGTFTYPQKPSEEEEIEYDFYTKESFIWRIEAESHEVRANHFMQLESLDESYYIYADSRRAKEKLANIYNVPRTYRGAMYINQFMIAEEKGEFGDEEVPIAFLLKTADTDLTLTMIPKFKKGAPKAVAQIDGVNIVSLTEFEPPVFDGYIGWGIANLTVQDDAALGAAVVEGGGWDYWEIPITVRVKGAQATVRFVDLFLGPVELKGRFFGMEKDSPAVPPQPSDPSKSYSPGKPDNLPPKAENPLDDLEGVTQDGNKITQPLEGGGSVSIIYPSAEEDEEEEKSVTVSTFKETWNNAINYSEQVKNPDNWED
ncbi:MAG: hypothetical protein ACOYIF_09400 [Acetivibrionales bacterium]